MKPMEIEQASMAIIERELQVALDPEIKPIVKRVIHATADFSFAESMVFTPGVVPYARELLARGAMIVTDTQMALSGISKPALKKLGCQAVCFMADEDIAREAKEMLLKTGLPCIVARGRRGGSNVAAAIVNALLYGMEGVRA